MRLDDAIVMFAKAPEPGRVKTRLAADLGEEEAAELYAAFLSDLAGTLSDLPVRRVLAWDGDADHRSLAHLRTLDFDVEPQGTGDLGARLTRIVRRVVEQGARRVVVIGSDSPSLQPDHFETAFRRLDEHDVVLGPSFDGGYYLIGLTEGFVRAFAADETLPVFDDVDWSTSDVLGQTIRRCRAADALCDLLAFWYDVDTLEDLKFLKIHLLEFLCHTAGEVCPTTVQRLRELEARGSFPPS